MRHLIISVDPAKEDDVLRSAFAAGAGHVLRSSKQECAADGSSRTRTSLDVMLSAPRARRLINALSALPPGSWSVISVHPRSVFGGTTLFAETRPYPVAGLEMEDDLWEFAHVTTSLVMRVLLAGALVALVALGMVAGNLPVMLAGLLFLPYHHALIAVALAALRRRGALAGRAVVVFVLSTALLVIAGYLVAVVAGGPLGWHPQGGPVSALGIGAIVGAAAGFGSADDAGRRELIGLAATAHLSVLPVWAGLTLGLGTGDMAEMAAKATEFGLAVAALTVAAGAVLWIAGAAQGVPPE